MSKMILKIKRGTHDKLPSKFEYGELFYISDLNIIGVGDRDGNPQLLVELEKYDNKESFPKEYKNSTLYYSKEEDKTYYYDLSVNDYLPITFKTKLYGIERLLDYSFKEEI